MLTETTVGKIRQLPETVRSVVATLAKFTAALKVTFTAVGGAPDPSVNDVTVGPRLSKVLVTPDEPVSHLHD